MLHPVNHPSLSLSQPQDGTTVTIRVGNDENFSGELRNNTAQLKSGMAMFNDLRFIGRSGRGKQNGYFWPLHPLQI